MVEPSESQPPPPPSRSVDVTVRVRPEDEMPPSQHTGQRAAVGSMIDNRYRVEAELGRGAMGVVYRATEVWLDRVVALKLIAPGALGDSSAPVSLHREAKALASIRSQHVVQVHAFGVHEGSYFFAMEY